MELIKLFQLFFGGIERVTQRNSYAKYNVHNWSESAWSLILALNYITKLRFNSLRVIENGLLNVLQGFYLIQTI